jgi:hypothetical protein
MSSGNRGPSKPWIKSIDDWLVTCQAVNFFVVSAVCSLALTPILLGWVHLAEMSFWIRIPWAILTIIGPIGLVSVYFGMWLYWVRVDHSAVWAKRLWFVIPLLGPWYGNCLYCFFVYLPQVLRKTRARTV